MRLQAFVVVLLVAATAGFALLNPDILSEAREVQLPGTQVSAPILGITILAAAGALLLMLVLGALAEIAHTRAQRRMHARVAQREQELAFVKSAAYDRVAGTIEALYREVPALLE